ncbi:hypothetical protein HanRHA438_Chr11g0511071 [Helianthus annuus]|nr:hypothetical protein HanIR_Chr11g0536621 [Helianthus annuus]KAJ0871327.1 hypothetical protein HanRHA438_Chr11g0511071 [Helianthus annuus]
MNQVINTGVKGSIFTKEKTGSLYIYTIYFKLVRSRQQIKPILGLLHVCMLNKMKPLGKMKKKIQIISSSAQYIRNNSKTR